uniref:Uncharacterized protein n=1 Tax=Salix viminalis TaxID=40686 RepID=A0A6N2N7C4_SALVM
MWFRGGLGGGGGNIGSILKDQIVRRFSRARAVDVKRINPKVPFSEAASIAQSLYHVIKEHGPLTVSNTWNQVKEADISGLNSKTHMKIMLKWMRGRKMLKLFCNPNSNKFLHCTLPEEPRTEQPNSAPELSLQTKKKPSKKKTSMKRKKQHK